LFAKSMRDADDKFYATFPQAKQAHLGQGSWTLDHRGPRDTYFESPTFCHDANGNMNYPHPPTSASKLYPASYVHPPIITPSHTDRNSLLPQRFVNVHYGFKHDPIQDPFIRAPQPHPPLPFATNDAPRSAQEELLDHRPWAQQRSSGHDPPRLVDYHRRPPQNVVSALRPSITRLLMLITSTPLYPSCRRWCLNIP
jgi:hypothetical protein